jgi:serine/threonine protein kinase/tetratricopeptide (TPR) repeat protein/WD40 repeat protein
MKERQTMKRCPGRDELQQLVDDTLDPARQEEMETHLGICAACKEALEGLIAGMDVPWRRAGSDATSPSAPDRAFLDRLKKVSPSGPSDSIPVPPPAIEGYEILGELGRGGMGVVYKARQVSLNRVVALKMILSGSHASAAEMARFRAEAEAVARLQHPNIVQIHEVGASEGRPFFSLEYVDGGSLARRLDGTPWPPQPAAELVQTLAGAVDAAHQAGVIHRDLKPANILLGEGKKGEDGKRGSRDRPSDASSLAPFPFSPSSVKITDFGLAKQLDSAQPQTQSGAILGTPSYMAPEQAGAKGKEVCPATDVYALGAILYELLTGRPPFNAETPMETLYQVMHEEPVPPSRLRPKVPRDLETVCLKCLRKEPPRRYDSADALADDLRRFLRGEPIQARPISRWEKGWKWAKRRPTVASLLAAIVGLCVVSFAFVTALWLRAEDARDREKKEVIEKEEANKAKAAAEAEKWRTTLDEYHAKTETYLAKARLLRDATDRPDARTELLNLMGEVAALRDQSDRVLQELSDPAGVLVPEERRWWDERASVLRNEVTRELTSIRLQRGRSIALPEGPVDGAIPAVALRADLQQMAVVYPGTTTIMIMGLDGQELYRLNVPQEFANAAHKTETVIRGWLGWRNTNTNSTTFSYRFAYVGEDRLEYQVGHKVLSWVLPGPEAKADERPLSEPQPLYGGWNASSDRYSATAAAWGSTVTVREWTSDARPVVMWQSKDEKKAGAPDHLDSLVFGPDGRALFIRSATRLSLVDAASGAETGVPLIETGTTIAWGRMIPCQGGVAMVEERSVGKRHSPPRLVFWNASLPLVRMRALHQDEPPESMDWAADGLLVTGGGDHLVRAWQGQRQAWASGIPYAALDKERVSSPRRLPSVDFPIGDLHGAPSFRQSTASEWEGLQRAVWATTEPRWEEGIGYSPPPPYPAWSFFETGGQPLLVERRELLANGRSCLRTELCAADDGRLVYSFPAEGNARILDSQGLSPDYRFAVVVADEKDQRAALEVWSVEDHLLLGRLGRYRLPVDNPALHKLLPLRTTFVSTAGKDWLLLSNPVGPGTRAELEIWRLPEVQLVGRVALPTCHGAARVTQDKRRAVVFGGNRYFPPQFALLVDLETAAKVCDLEDYEAKGRDTHENSIFTGTALVSVWRGALNIDPYHVSAWDLTTGKRTDLGDTLWINSKHLHPTLSPTSDRLLLYSNLHETGLARVELWDLQKLKLLHAATYPTTEQPWGAEYREASFSLDLPDCPEKGQTRRVHWRWADGAELVEPPAGDSRLVLWSRPYIDQPWTLLAWWDQRRLVLDSGAGKERVPLQNTGDIVFTDDMWSSSDGKFICLVGKGGGLWDTATGRKIAAFSPQMECRGFDGASRWVLTVDPAKGEIAVWDTKTGAVARRCIPAQSTDPPFDPVHSPLKLHPGGTRLAVLSNGVLRLWDLEHNRQVMAFDKPGHFTPVTCVAQHAGAGLVASGGGEGVILLWNRADGQLVRTLIAHAAPIVGLAFSPDGTHLASAVGRTLSLSDLEGHTLWTSPVAGQDTRITYIAFHPGGPSLIAGTQDGRLLVLDPATGHCRADKQVDPGGVKAVASSPDGTLLAFGSRSGRVHLWDVHLGEIRRSWDTYSPVAAVTFVGGNELLATGGQSVQFWETNTGRSVWTVEVPHAPVRALVMNEKDGELGVADQGEKLLVFNLPELHNRLERLKLGFSAFPRRNWAASEESRGGAGPGWRDWHQRAEEFRRDKEWGQAVWACTNAIEMQPDEWRLWRLRGMAYTKMAKNGQDVWSNALADHSQALALKQDDWQIWQGRGEAHAGLRQWRQAIDDYSKGIELDSRQAELWHARGAAQNELHRYDLAVADFDEALRLDREHASARVERCESLRWKGEFDRAIADLSEALQRDPYDEFALAVRSAAYRGKGQFDLALADVDEALRLRPNYAFAFAQRGELRRFQGKYDLALADLDDAVALDPHYANAFAARGLVFQLKDNHARALADYTDAIRLDPEAARLYRTRGDMHVARREYAQAVDNFSQALRLEPTDAPTLRIRGYTRYRQGDLDGAIADFDEAIWHQPIYALAYNDRGLAYVEKRQRYKALADYDEATRLDPKLLFPYYNRGEVYRFLRQYDKAIADYTKAIALNGKHLGSWEGRGQSRAEMGQWDMAAADFGKGFELAPGYAGLKYRQALTLLARGDEKGYGAACAPLVEKFRDTTDRDIASLVAWAGVLVPDAVEDVKTCVRLVQRAAAADPKSYVFAYTLGAALYRAGRLDDAERELIRANQLPKTGGAPYAWLLLALTNARLGHADEAKKWLDKAVERMDQYGRAKSMDGTSDEFWNWQMRLEYDLLRREAEAILSK